jgi:hypothetical protein
MGAEITYLRDHSLHAGLSTSENLTSGAGLPRVLFMPCSLDKNDSPKGQLAFVYVYDYLGECGE